MHFVLTGTALELQDKLAGELPVEANKWEEKDGEKVATVTPYKITSVTSVNGFQKLCDTIFAVEVKAEAEEWSDDSGSSSDSEG